MEQRRIVTLHGAQVDHLAGDHRANRTCRPEGTQLFGGGFPEESHTGIRTPVHIEGLAGDELSVIASEKGDGRGDVGWAPNASPRYQRVAELGCVARHVEVARHFDDTGANSVHPHMTWRELDR
jgi:hypothetical protein